MADIKMNAFAPVSDAAYVYVELADGSQGKIRKADLVELIRINMPEANQNTSGLMPANMSKIKFSSSDVAYDCNNAVIGSKVAAYHWINGPISAAYSEMVTYGLWDGWRFQMFFIINTSCQICVRTESNGTGNWTAWKNISFTS